MENKICKKCLIDKNINDYHKNKNICKECRKNIHRETYIKKEKLIKDKQDRTEYMKDYYKNNSNVIKNNSKEYKSKNTDKVKEYNKEYKSKNTDKVKEYNIKFYISNKEYYKKYYTNNKAKLNSNKNEYNKNRCEHDMIFKLVRNIRSLINNTFKHIGIKKNNRTEKILGCSIDEFRLYIEKQFEKWMIWQNHGIYTGNYNETWQLDHIEPISNATTPEDIIRLNHYTNFQPLCSKKNLEKSNKY